MASSIFDLFQSDSRKTSRQQLDERRRQYRYRSPEDNLLAPIAMCEKPPKREDHPAKWLAAYMPRYLTIAARGKLDELSEGVQKALLNFDKMDAYRQLLGDHIPRYAEHGDSNEAFAYRRVAGGNPIVIRQEKQLARLRREKIPFDKQRIERWLEENRPKHWKGSTDLAAAAKEGRVFVVDFELIQSALESRRRGGTRRKTRDSRWRGKYAAAPIALLLEAPGFYGATDLVPLAIQIDQPQPEGEYNPVYYPDDGWGWQIAKLYVESADASHHLGCGHVFRNHLIMEAFCIATPRQLPQDHPVHVLLEPHMALTLTTNDSVYQNFNERKQLYYEFYTGDLEELRHIAIISHERTGFRQLQIEREIGSRGVAEGPADYPYRDDGVLWWAPIERFVRRYVGLHYDSDASIADEPELQAWVAELVDPHRGAVRDLLEDGRLDTREKLVELLTQLLFTAGPGHASMHFAGNYFYRYAPVMPSTAMMPPPESAERATHARYLRTLPSIGIARDQWVSSNQGSYRYGRFGHYDGFALGDDEKVAEAIDAMLADLQAVKDIIDDRQRTRPYRYDVWSPALVPNSVNL